VSGSSGQAGDGQDEDGQEEALEKAAQVMGLAYATLSLAYLLWMLWMHIPEHRRRLLLMITVNRADRFLGRLAFRTGHQAMGREISGQGQNYGLPLVLSAARDKAAAAYEKLRYSS